MKPFGYSLRRKIQLFNESRRSGRPLKRKALQNDVERELEDQVGSPVSTVSDNDGGVSLYDDAGNRIDLGAPAASPADDSKVRDFAMNPMAGPSIDQNANLDKSQPDISEDAPAPDMDAHGDHAAGVQSGNLETVDLQAIRDGKYLQFEGEDETDYTAGPARMVFASDGVQDQCGAILLTLDFSFRLQRAVLAQREFAKAERQAAREAEVAMNFELDLEREIMNHEGRLMCLEDVAAAEAGVEATIREELDILRAMMQESKMKRRNIEAQLHDQAVMLRQIQAEATVYVEDVLVHANLLPPVSDEPDTPIGELNLQEQYQAFRAAQQQTDGDDNISIAPLDTNWDHLQVPPLSPEEQAAQDLRDAYWAALERFQAAQATFDRRAFDRAIDLEVRKQAIALGEEPIDASEEEFDARWVIHIQELTQDLIAAEEAFAQAKAKARAADVDLGEADKESGFGDDPADGYRMSFEAEIIATAPKPKIDQWLNGLQSPGSPSFEDAVEVQVDDCEARTVDVGDSLTIYNGNPDQRRRIDKWQSTCHRAGSV